MKVRKINLSLSTLMIMCFFSIFECFSQQKQNIQTENCIREKVNSFFLEKDKLNNKEASGNSVHILEIVEKRVLGYDKMGIYFCSNAPSRQKYFLLKGENKFKIITSDDLFEIMQEITLFLKTNKIVKEKAIEYLKESINIVNENMSKPSEKKLYEQQWINCN